MIDAPWEEKKPRLSSAFSLPSMNAIRNTENAGLIFDVMQGTCQRPNW